MNLFFYPDDSKILKTWNQNSSFKYFLVVKIEKQIRPFVFWEKLRIDNFVSRSTDFYKDPEITCLLIAQGYGLTETTGGISLSTKKDLSVATVGQTLPGVRIKLKDWDEGDYLVQGKNDIGPCGEILIGGPMVASGKDLFRIGQNTSHQISFLKLQLRGAKLYQ